MSEQTQTVVDEATKAELQPPCDSVIWHDGKVEPRSECQAPAEFVRRVLCGECGGVSVRLRCAAHLLYGVGSGFHVACGKSGEHNSLISIEPLR